MSIKLMERVWETALPTSEKMVLLVIADHANDSGTNAWPGMSTIARKASMTTRSVQRHIRSLEERGIIVTLIQQGGTEWTRGDRRPNRYDIVVSALDGVTGSRPATNGVTNETSRGDKQDITGRQMEQNGVTWMSPYPSLEPSIEPPVEPSVETALVAIEHDEVEVLTEAEQTFEQFWRMYPRKDAKKRSATLWRNMKKTEREMALAALPDHIAYWQETGREREHIPMPATWLFGQRWQDQLAGDWQKPESLVDRVTRMALQRNYERSIKDDSGSSDGSDWELDGPDDWME